MNGLQRLLSAILPARASTQTWMMLTFALFVGAAVVGVALYIALVLHQDVHRATRNDLRVEASRITAVLDEAATPAAREEAAEAASRLTGLRIRLVPVTEAPGTGAASETFSRVRENGGPAVLQITIVRPEQRYAASVSNPKPALLGLVRRLEIGLISATLLALLLALLGSWVASRQITRPLTAITESARNIVEGRVEERIEIDTRAREFQDLEQSLNRMAGSFQNQIDELNRMAQVQNEFIGNVSHEVRNPIFAVSGYLEALGSSTLSDGIRLRYAEKGLSNLQRLNNLFNDLIEIARLEYREDLIRTKVFELSDLVDEVTDILGLKAAEKHLSLETANPPIRVLADRNRIRQVFTNLIDNAISYTDEGTVRCRFRRRLDKVRIEIVDTGRGIPDEHIERIYERFYRVDPDRSRKSGGTGLGLSIVKQILHAHGEPIHVESTPGRGTRFWFELPLAPVMETEEG